MGRASQTALLALTAASFACDDGMTVPLDVDGSVLLDGGGRLDAGAG